MHFKVKVYKTLNVRKRASLQLHRLHIFQKLESTRKEHNITFCFFEKISAAMRKEFFFNFAYYTVMYALKVNMENLPSASFCSAVDNCILMNIRRKAIKNYIYSQKSEIN